MIWLVFLEVIRGKGFLIVFKTFFIGFWILLNKIFFGFVIKFVDLVELLVENELFDMGDDVNFFLLLWFFFISFIVIDLFNFLVNNVWVFLISALKFIFRRVFDLLNFCCLIGRKWNFSKVFLGK